MSGAPSASLLATRTGSVIWGVGEDWDKATTRTVGDNQSLVDEFLASAEGEKLGDFDVFHPERMASRILGMGDVLTLIEQAEKTFEADEAERKCRMSALINLPAKRNLQHLPPDNAEHPAK